MNTTQLINQYLKHTGHAGNSGAMHYKKIGNNLVDLFMGDGWNTPTRYRLIKGTWVYQQGPRLVDAVATPALSHVAKG